MSVADIEAIRERARAYPGVSDDSPMLFFIEAIEAWDGSGKPPETPKDANLWRWYHRAAQDRRALLIALDAMTTERNGWGDTAQEYEAERDAARAALDRMTASRDAYIETTKTLQRAERQRSLECDAARADAEALAEAGQHDPACKSRSAVGYDEAGRMLYGLCACDWGPAIAAHEAQKEKA